MGGIPGWEAKIPHALGSKNIKQKQYCNKFNKDFNNGQHFFFFLRNLHVRASGGLPWLLAASGIRQE